MTMANFLRIDAFFLVFPVAEKDCKQCPTVLQELENIDDEAEDAGKFLTIFSQLFRIIIISEISVYVVLK